MNVMWWYYIIYPPRHKKVGSPAYCVGCAGALSPGNMYGHRCSTVWHTERQGLTRRRPLLLPPPLILLLLLLLLLPLILLPLPPLFTSAAADIVVLVVVLLLLLLLFVLLLLLPLFVLAKCGTNELHTQRRYASY